MQQMAVPSAKKMTIREIADIAGVSIATVSRVLNGRDDVSDETRDAVRRVIQEQGYTREPARARAFRRPDRPRRRARPARLSRRTSRRSSPAPSEALYEQDMRVVLSPTQHEHAREVSLLDRLMHGATDGALIVLPEESSEELERALDGRLPVRRRRPAAAARRAHPVGLRRAHVGRRPGDAAPARRSATAGSARSPGRPAGWRPRTAGAATAPRSPPRASCSIRRSRSRPTSRSPRARRPPARLLDLRKPPTAIFAFNDNIAIGDDAGGARARPAHPGATSPSSASTTSSTRRS